MSPELQAELRQAWAELTEAAKASKVKNFPRMYTYGPALDGRPGGSKSHSGHTS